MRCSCNIALTPGVAPPLAIDLALTCLTTSPALLAQAYFMNYDNTFNRLQTLHEYIKDTEDLVNIKLDQHRNQLITVDLILTALTCAMAMVTTVSGIFGMNLDSGLQDAPNVFNEVTIATSLGAMILFMCFIIFAWRRGLLAWS